MLALIVTNLARRRARTLLTAIGIGVGVATIVALLSLTAGLNASAERLIHLGNADFGVFQSGLSDVTASSLPLRAVDRVRKVPGVAEAAPLQLVVGQLAGSPSFIVFGIPRDSFVERRLVIVAGHAAHTDAQALVGDTAAARLHLGPGDTLKLKRGSFRITGIYHSGVTYEDQGAVVSLAAAQRLTGRRGQATTIGVVVARGYTRREVAQRVQRALPGTVAIDEPGEISRLDTNSVVISKAALAIAVLALVIGGISVTNTMLISALERQRELGVLAAIGWAPWQVARLIFGEGVGVSMIGAAIGLGLGVAGGELVVRALSASQFVSPEVTAWGLGRGLLVGVAIGVLGGLYPAWRVTRLDPVAALRRE